jgi:hypothetical protein
MLEAVVTLVRVAGGRPPMVRKISVVGGLVALVALVVATLGPAAGAADETDGTIRVKSFTTQEQFVDLPPQNFSLGDEFVFSARLMKSGELVGNLGVVCTVTSTRTETVQCVATATFQRWFHGGGQITIQGLLIGEPENFTLAVTGGTGSFVGAEGQVHVRQVTETLEVLTFELQD